MTYSTRKAADQLGVNINTLLRWINLGKIKARKAVFGNGWVFTDEDIRAIRKWRGAPLAALDLAKVDQAPERVAPQHAHLRPDLKLFGEYFSKTKSWARGSEHPRELLPHLAPANGEQFLWSILDSQEYLEALAAHRAKDAATPARPLSPIQEETNRLFEQWEKEQNE